MNSPFANLFLLLQEHINSQVRDIPWVDQDVGQLAAKSRPPVAWPCVLIDFDDFGFSSLGENVQTAEGTVVLRLGFAAYSRTHTGSPGQYAEQALGYYDLEWQLHKALHGWSPGDQYGSLERISATTLPRPDNYRIRELRYKLSFNDYSTKHEQQYAPASLVLRHDLVTGPER